MTLTRKLAVNMGGTVLIRIEATVRPALYPVRLAGKHWSTICFAVALSSGQILKYKTEATFGKACGSPPANRNEKLISQEPDRKVEGILSRRRGKRTLSGMLKEGASPWTPSSSSWPFGNHVESSAVIGIMNERVSETIDFTHSDNEG